MTTCREFSTFSWPLRGRGRGGQPKRSAWPLFRSFFFAAFPNRLSMRFDENASWSRNLPDIFTIITNKHSSFKILSQTQLWSGPMRALVTQALCLHISSYECSHCPDHDWVWQQRGCVISSHSVDNRLCSCQQIDYKNFTKFTTKFGDSWNCVSFWHKICHWI